MVWEFDEKRILRPEGEVIVFAVLFSACPLSGHDTTPRWCEFEVKVPNGTGEFEVSSECGKLRGTMRIEEDNRGLRVLREVLMKPAG
jgi:hypothetical protein